MMMISVTMTQKFGTPKLDIDKWADIGDDDHKFGTPKLTSIEIEELKVNDGKMNLH